jgi:hypothetical protein
VPAHATPLDSPAWQQAAQDLLNGQLRQHEVGRDTREVLPLGVMSELPDDVTFRHLLSGRV